MHTCPSACSTAKLSVTRQKISTMTLGRIMKVIENDMYQFPLYLSLSLRSCRMAEPRAKVSEVIQCRDDQTNITEQRTDSIVDGL